MTWQLDIPQLYNFCTNFFNDRAREQGLWEEWKILLTECGSTWEQIVDGKNIIAQEEDWDDLEEDILEQEDKLDQLVDNLEDVNRDVVEEAANYENDV